MKTLNIKIIRIDGGTQSRQKIDEMVVAEYAAAVAEGAQFPPVKVFFDGTDTYLADGFHRYFAHLKAGKASIPAEVVNGTLRDAILYSCGANSMHGLQRTNEDKRKAVMLMLEDFEWGTWSDREIARQCNVSHVFVANLRKDNQPETKKQKTSTGKIIEKPVKKKPETLEEVMKDFVHVDQKDEAVVALTEENERLSDRLAVVAMDATEEEKKQAEQTISDLREEIRLLKIENEALKISRDTFQAENAQMKKQIAMLQKKLKD
jgi:hypothetical protein